MDKKKKNIVWIASYPKSGNTWLRTFLSNLMSDTHKPVHINDLKQTPLSSNRDILDGYLGTLSSELSSNEIDLLRPQFFEKLSDENNDTVYIKTHESWTLNSQGNPLFPKELTKGVIYIIRNPLDVVISYANHNNASIAETILALNNEEFKLCAGKNRLYPQTQQILTSWSGHAISWIDKSNLPVHVIKYEDMLDSPLNSFGSVVKFLKLKQDESKIRIAIKHSSFDTLKAMEYSDGFQERSIHSKAFFRKGKSNEWMANLTKTQVDDIIKHHVKTMKRFGYINI